MVHSNQDIIHSIDKLVKRVDKLVSIFEEAAKHVTDVESSEHRVNALATKLDALLEQNKQVAKGLILLEKYVRGKTSFETQETKSPRALSDFGSL